MDRDVKDYIIAVICMGLAAIGMIAGFLILYQGCNG